MNKSNKTFDIPIQDFFVNSKKKPKKIASMRY